MKDERGVAPILALLVLSFLTILGGRLLTTSTIDVWISGNYKTSTENLYLAEAGVDHAREIRRNTSQTPCDLLAFAAGPDHQLSTSTDRGTLLASDDPPLIPSDPAMRSTGHQKVADHLSDSRLQTAVGLQSLAASITRTRPTCIRPHRSVITECPSIRLQ